VIEVLGITDRTDPVAGLDLRPVCGLGVATAPHADIATPRARLARQVACADALACFLPMSPASPTSFDVFAPWLEARSGDVAPLLPGLHGQRQLTLRLDAVPRRAPEGATWLRRRAAECAREHEAVADLETWCRRLGATGTARDADPRVVHALCARKALPTIIAGLAGGGASAALDGWRVVVTGPWPVFAFAPRLVAPFGEQDDTHGDV
jgi:hypothetical protein